jgi:mannose-6-phosphate isomerase-like protein (cupin superfamily)
MCAMIRKKSDMELEIKEKMRGGEGSINITHVFSQDEFKSNVRLCAKMTINPGCSIGEHSHFKEDEVYYILNGKGLVSDVGTEYEVNPGDSVLTGNGGSHSIKCIGNKPLEMIAFVILY